MALAKWQIQPPMIRVQRSRSTPYISCNDYILITTDSPDHRIFFTTDGTEPDPIQKFSNTTCVYRGPFRLNPGPYRTVTAIAVSRSGQESCASSKDFDIVDGSVSADESSTGLSGVSEDTYTVESNWSPRTAATLSDVHFSPGGHVYMRRGAHQRREPELDVYFEQSYLRAHEPLNQRQQAWQEAHSSENSDAETEVTNYFRASKQHPSSHREYNRLAHSQQDNRTADWHHYQPPCESSVGSRRQVHFTGQSLDENAVSAYSRRLPDSDVPTALVHQSLPHAVHSQSPGTFAGPNRTTSPLADAGYQMGQRYATQDSGFQQGINAGSAFRPVEYQERNGSFAGSHVNGYARSTHAGDNRLHTSRVNNARLSYPQQINAPSLQEKKTEKSGEDKTDEKTDEKKTKEKKAGKKKDAKKSIRSSSESSSESEAEKKKKQKSHKKKSKKEKRSKSLTGSSSEGEAEKKKKQKSHERNAKKENNHPDNGYSNTTKQNATKTVGPSANEKPGKNSDGRMNFINDSGTQINVWGAKQEDVLKHLSTDVQSLIINHPAEQTLARPAIEDTTQSAGDGLRVAQTESEQKSFGSAFRDFFGFGSRTTKKKKKKKRKGRGQEGPEEEEEEEEEDDDDGYEQIRAQCLEDGCLWEDPDFPAVDAAIYYENQPEVWPVEWKRPHEICSDPQMFVSGASRFDVKQGVLGNCWLLAAVASLSSNEKLIQQVVPPGQSFKREYAGIFRFRFWQYGKWQEVCVDDRLPTKHNKLIYMHSADSNEFWTPLLEKAYAKLNLNYESLSGGQTSDAMTDFTGGCVEKFDFRDDLPSSMLSILLKAQQRSSLMGCSIDSSGTVLEEELPNGLIMGHAYTITDVKMVVTRRESEGLVRVRNPWGNECEWKGAWGDGSKEWNGLSSDMKRELGLTFEHDGEFWMSFRDFSTHFQRVEICNLQPDCLADASRGEQVRSWKTSIQRGKWRKKMNAGGCRNYPRTFWTNPQFNVQITDVDDDDDEDVGTIIIGLMQCGRRKLRKSGQDNLTIGYEIYTAGEQDRSGGTLSEDFLRRARTVASSASYINTREVCGRHRLPPGHYTIIPTTFEPNEEAEFVVRIFSEKENQLMELDEKTSHIQLQQMAPVNSAAGNRLCSEAKTQFLKHHGEDMEIDAYELREILNNVFTKDFEFGGFDLNLCRSMIAMTDLDMTGKLEFEEFEELWQFLQNCKITYRQFDKDQNGSFNSYELREALKSVGYNLSNEAFNGAVMRFSDKDGNVKFDDFVACVIKLKATFDAFHDKNDAKAATFTLDNLVQLTMHA